MRFTRNEETIQPQGADAKATPQNFDKFSGDAHLHIFYFILYVFPFLLFAINTISLGIRRDKYCYI